MYRCVTAGTTRTLIRADATARLVACNNTGGMLSVTSRLRCLSVINSSYPQVVFCEPCADVHRPGPRGDVQHAAVGITCAVQKPFLFRTDTRADFAIQFMWAASQHLCWLWDSAQFSAS